MNYNKRDFGLFALRLVLGLIFLVHGYQKLTGLEGTTGFFTTIGIPLASITAILVAVIEFFGGLFLILGLFTNISSIAIAVVMIGSIIYVHGSNGFTGQGGYEFPLLAIASAITIWSLGKGRITVQSFFTKS